MSTICAEIARIDGVCPHPNADKLEIVTVGGAESCVTKGSMLVGDLVIFFPPNLLIPQPMAEKLNVANYLKDCIFPGETTKSKCRVAACRLRNVPSFGFVVPLQAAADAIWESSIYSGEKYAEFQMLAKEPGTDVSSYFGAVKYTPPVRNPGCKGFNGDAAPDHPCFHEYTDVENHYKYPNAIPDGTPVRITEKVHGTNARLGLIRVGAATDDTSEFSLMAGSHHRNLKPVTEKGDVPLWWQHMTNEVVNLLTHLCDEKHSVIVFGEIYGASIQDMDYGCSDGEPQFRVFDIAVNGQYLGWYDVSTQCAQAGVATVPLLYIGPFSKAVMLEHTYGPTTISEQVRAKFKGREGCIITPLTESFSPSLYGRMILKSVSADYLDRKNAQDNE